MADPLSITAGVVGIVVPALHGTRLLLDDLQLLKDAPKTVKRLTEDVQSVSVALELLQAVEDREWNLLGAGVTAQANATISSCTEACEIFRTSLQQWTRHSDDGKLAWQDRTVVGVFKQGQIKSMSEQLSNCKLSINSVVGIATLYSSVRHSHVTEEIKKAVSTKQIQIKNAITDTDKQLVIVENRLEELNISSDEEEAAEPREGRPEALKQLEEEIKAVKASQKLLSELLAKSQEEAVAKAAGMSQSTTVNFGNNNSGFQAGTVTGGVSGISFGGK